jgi:hypothetical protein
LVLTWARDIEIARRPDLAARHTRATRDLEHEDAAVAHEALRELSARGLGRGDEGSAELS